MIAASLASITLVASMVVNPTPSATPLASDVPPPPSVSAERWIVYDALDEVVLASWNANVRAPMASVTKVMTAIVVLENADLSEVVTIPDFVSGIRGSTAALTPGEQWTVGDLLIALMIRSGNDAAFAIAHHVGGQSTAAFVDMMNAKAVELGMADTRFANPAGLDAEDHFSTATDLLTLIIASREYPDIVRLGRIKSVTMPPDSNGTARSYTNTNRLVGSFPGAIGLKTGDTPSADKVLLGVTERSGRAIYSVVMHADDHFADTRELVEWAYETNTIADRWLRPLYSEEGGGGAPTPDLDLTDSHERRLRAMTRLADGRWNTSSLEDLPKAEMIARWIRDAIPGIAGG